MVLAFDTHEGALWRGGERSKFPLIDDLRYSRPCFEEFVRAKSIDSRNETIANVVIGFIVMILRNL